MGAQTFAKLLLPRLKSQLWPVWSDSSVYRNSKRAKTNISINFKKTLSLNKRFVKRFVVTFNKAVFMSSEWAFRVQRVEEWYQKEEKGGP